MLPEMRELIETFEPYVLWSDGDWEADPDYFGSKDFLAWLYNDSPVKDYVVTNDRQVDAKLKKFNSNRNESLYLKRQRCKVQTLPIEREKER